jgi:hypothetical protein
MFDQNGKDRVEIHVKPDGLQGWRWPTKAARASLAYHKKTRARSSGESR